MALGIYNTFPVQKLLAGHGDTPNQLSQAMILSPKKTSGLIRLISLQTDLAILGEIQIFYFFPQFLLYK